jgi:hypothetical protein
MLLMAMGTACGDDDDDEIEQTAGTGGSGGGGTGGGSALSCGGASCEGIDIMGFALPACCTESDTCGVDGSLAVALGLELGCVSFDEFGEMSEVPEDGIIHGPNGEIIVLDASCPGISLTNPLLPIDLPGCCRPDNSCGGSTHDAQALPIGDVPFDCANHAEVQEFISSIPTVGDFITVPADPGATCTYEGPDPVETDAGVPETDAGVPETDAGVPETDAGVADAGVEQAS